MNLQAWRFRQRFQLCNMLVYNLSIKLPYQMPYVVEGLDHVQSRHMLWHSSIAHNAWNIQADRITFLVRWLDHTSVDELYIMRWDTGLNERFNNSVLRSGSEWQTWALPHFHSIFDEGALASQKLQPTNGAMSCGRASYVEPYEGLGLWMNTESMTEFHLRPSDCLLFENGCFLRHNNFESIG